MKPFIGNAPTTRNFGSLSKKWAVKDKRECCPSRDVHPSHVKDKNSALSKSCLTLPYLILKLLGLSILNLPSFPRKLTVKDLR